MTQCIQKHYFEFPALDWQNKYSEAVIQIATEHSLASVRLCFSGLFSMVLPVLICPVNNYTLCTLCESFTSVSCLAKMHLL